MGQKKCLWHFFNRTDQRKPLVRCPLVYFGIKQAYIEIVNEIPF